MCVNSSDFKRIGNSTALFLVLMSLVNRNAYNVVLVNSRDWARSSPPGFDVHPTADSWVGRQCILLAERKIDFEFHPFEDGPLAIFQVVEAIVDDGQRSPAELRDTLDLLGRGVSFGIGAIDCSAHPGREDESPHLLGGIDVLGAGRVGAAVVGVVEMPSFNETGIGCEVEGWCEA